MRRTMGMQGFGLVELMIAMVIGLVLTVGVLKVHSDNQRTARVQADLGLIQERGRYALELVSRDLRRAGYLGGNGDVASVLGVASETAHSGCNSADSTWARSLGEPIFGIDDSRAGYDCLEAAEYTRGDVLVVRYAAARVASGFSAERPYLRTSLFAGRVFDGADQASFPAVDVPSSTRALVAHAYFVGPSARSCPDGSLSSALYWKRVGDDGVPISEELVPGVSQLQVRYGVDSDADGIADRYVDAGDVVSGGGEDWSDVRTVRFWLLVGSGCAEGGYRDTHSWQMGNVSYAPADAIRRQLYSTTVALRNR